MPLAQSPAYWPDAIAALSEADEVMARIIEAYAGEAMQGKDDAFHTLMRSITGQQISLKAADAIWGRLESACQARISSSDTEVQAVNPHIVATITEEELRAVGYSRQKVSYIQSLSAFFCTRKHAQRDWMEMSDEEVIADLTQVRGIGRWTAEMFLMFYMQRPDILPLDDLGAMKAMWKLYNGGEKMDKKAMRQLATRWQPWRTVATWYLWRSADGDAVVSY